MLLSGGVLFADMPWQAADSLASALSAKARQAEEQVKAGDIIYDNAICMRAGLPFGLSNRRDIVCEAMKEAAWNTNLRRYMPGGVKSKEVFGTPTVRHGKRPAMAIRPSGVASQEVFGSR